MAVTTDYKLTKDFVSPVFCQHLNVAGLTDKTPFVWKVVRQTHILWTDQFDPDNYYNGLADWMNEFNNAKVIPAYTIGQMENCLPVNWLLERRGTGYTVSLDEIYKVPAVNSDRMADAIAKAVIEMLRLRVFDPALLNKKILL